MPRLAALLFALARGQLPLLVISYNVAGVFRREEELHELRRNMLAQYPQLRGTATALYVFNFQECFSARGVVGELLRSSNYDKLARTVAEFARGLLERARPDARFGCRESFHFGLVTVACRRDADERRGWTAKAFGVGWTAHGREYKGVYLGFKGLLGTAVALSPTRALLVVNLHISSRSLKDRLTALRRCKEETRAHVAAPNYLVLLAGDFNARSFYRAAPPRKERKAVSLSHNLGALYLMHCLAGGDLTVKGEARLRREGLPGLNCRGLLDLALRYDEVRPMMRMMLPSLAEPQRITFKPTYCFNREGSTHPRLCGKRSQLVPSYCDRVFAQQKPDFAVEWRGYFASEGSKHEVSDHVPVGAEGVLLDVSPADELPDSPPQPLRSATGRPLPAARDPNSAFDAEEFRPVFEAEDGEAPTTLLEAFLTQTEAIYAANWLPVAKVHMLFPVPARGELRD